MRPKSFLLAMLFLPYVIWIVSFLLSSLSQDLAKDSRILGVLLGISNLFSLLFGIGIVFWGVPYTVLVIGLLVWSRNKPVESIFKALFFSPLLLAALFVFGFLLWPLLSAILTIQLPTLADWINVVWYAFLAAMLSLVFGYLFVGLGLVLYKVFLYLRIIKSDPDNLDVVTVHTNP